MVVVAVAVVAVVVVVVVVVVAAAVVMAEIVVIIDMITRGSYGRSIELLSKLGLRNRMMPSQQGPKDYTWFRV